MKTILVGTFTEQEYPDYPYTPARLQERIQLHQKLQERGLTSRLVACEWPRNFYTTHQGTIHKASEHDKYADGGHILTPKGITLVSDHAGIPEVLPAHTPEERIQQLLTLYKKPLQLMPAPPDHWHEAISPHIDLVLLPLPEQHTLITDARYAQTFPQELQRLQEQTGWNIIPINQDWENPSYPCNSLLINQEDYSTSKKGPLLITNSHTPELFKKTIKDLGIPILEVPFNHNCSFGGSIHCATNTVTTAEEEKITDYLAQKEYKRRITR